jgi:hypothetical protein
MFRWVAVLVVALGALAPPAGASAATLMERLGVRRERSLVARSAIRLNNRLGSYT